MKMHAVTSYRSAIINAPNERWLKEQYEANIISSSHTYSFVVINIKRFQYINYKYGRAKADEALQILYDTAQKFLREDEWIAHTYSDNFSLLLRYQTRNDIRDNFLHPFVDEIFEIPHEVFYHNLYLSFGIYIIENPAATTFYEAQNFAEIIRKEYNRPDKRMFSYEVCSPAFFQQYLSFHQISEEVTYARHHKEFIPYIQPKIDVKTRQIVGGEVLLRRFDKEGNEIPLASFLPILNRNADIYSVDLYIFDYVCAFLRRQIDLNHKVLPLSFNITNTSVFDEDFMNDYLSVVHKYQIPESLIEFEFMEDIQYSQYSHIRTVIEQFHKEGFLCSLDDFGSGYSSFNILLEKNVDAIKLDHIFFDKPLTKQNKRIIENIIDIAKTLHTKVCAEGIETKEYVDFLSTTSCDIIQGYYFYRPMPLETYQNILDTQK